jgi:hypothetical protein
LLFADPASLTPDAVLDWHELLSAGLSQERSRIKTLGIGAILPSYLAPSLTGATVAEVDTYFKDCQTELDFSSSLVLIAAAEARIRHDAEKRQRDLTTSLGHRLSLIFSQYTSSWQVPLFQNGIMEEWKTHINSSFARVESAPLLGAIGDFKVALQFRHWIAHGRYWTLKRSLSDFEPQTVANVINNLYATISSAAVRTGLIAFT